MCFYLNHEKTKVTSLELDHVYTPNLSFFSIFLAGILRFQNENQQRLEENQKAQFASNAAGQWLGIRLQMLGVAMVTGVAFIAVLEHHFQTVNAGIIHHCLGLSICPTQNLGLKSMPA